MDLLCDVLWYVLSFAIFVLLIYSVGQSIVRPNGETQDPKDVHDG